MSPKYSFSIVFNIYHYTTNKTKKKAILSITFSCSNIILYKSQIYLDSNLATDCIISNCLSSIDFNLSLISVNVSD